MQENALLVFTQKKKCKTTGFLSLSRQDMGNIPLLKLE